MNWMQLEAWLRRGLASDTEQRFPDAGVMQAEWRRLMRSAEAHAQLEQAQVPNGEPATTRSPWWRRVIGR